MVKLLTLTLALTLAGCSSLEFRNLGKTITTTGVVYVIAGGLPAIASAATSMAYDEIIPDEPSVEQIETKEQAVAYVAKSWGEGLVWSFVAFLVITNLIGPWLARRSGYAKAKKKYKDV